MSIRRPRHRNWRDADGAKKKHILHNFVKLLAHAKPDKHQLQHFVASTLINRGTALLTHAAVQALAVSLLDHDCSHLTNLKATSQLLAEAPAPRPDPSGGLPTKELWLGGHTDRSRHNAERLPKKNFVKPP